MLARVRGLLAQAESTTYEAEAATFTAKAQELMARHALDHALLWERAGRDEKPMTIRLPIDDPYVDAKSMLLHVVAVHHGAARSSMSGTRCARSSASLSDVAATEVLSTSLLVQAQVAMRAEAATAAPGSRARSRSFRSSFLLVYVRCASTSASPRSTRPSRPRPTASMAARCCPGLAARSDVIDDAVDAMFGDLRPGRRRGISDAVGWAMGRAAADRAQLSFGDLDGEHAAAPIEPRPLPIG